MRSLWSFSMVKKGTKRHRLAPRSCMECAEGFGRIQWPRHTLIMEGFVDLGADGIFLDGIVMYGPTLQPQLAAK